MHPLAPILLSDARAIAGADIDCLVIGSGTSGVTTGIELADRGLKVAIVEAGPLVLTEHVGSGPFANREDIVPQIHDLVRFGTLWTSEKDLAAAQARTAETSCDSSITPRSSRSKAMRRSRAVSTRPAIAGSPGDERTENGFSPESAR